MHGWRRERIRASVTKWMSDGLQVHYVPGVSNRPTQGQIISMHEEETRQEIPKWRNKSDLRRASANTAEDPRLLHKWVSDAKWMTIGIRSHWKSIWSITMGQCLICLHPFLFIRPFPFGTSWHLLSRCGFLLSIQLACNCNNNYRRNSVWWEASIYFKLFIS